MKRVCSCCGRNRKIGKFGKRSDYSDGKNPCCRDCMREKRLKYSCTAIGKRKTNEAINKWKKGNKRQIKEYNKKYYEDNKNRILYNKKAREETECILITENSEKPNKIKINKGREICIVIDPKRK